MKYFLLIGIFGALAGCATVSNEYDAPLFRLQQSVAAASPYGVRWTSPNRREFKSGYFLQSGTKFREADALPQRMFAHWYILGDRRPYKVEVTVYMETKSGRGNYSSQGTSRESAKTLYEIFKRALDKRLDERNIIDDYKPF